jgi:ABC-type sugar transport system substrate-binding protein
VSGEGGIDRRTLLKRGGLLLLGASLPLPLSACGTTTHPAAEPAFGFIYASGPVEEAVMPENPPLGDFARLITAQAKQHQVSVTVTKGEEPQAELRTFVEPSEAESATGEHPPQYPVVVVSVPGIKLDPAVRKAVEGGVQLVSFLYPLPNAAASISVDPARMGTMLGEDVAAWVGKNGGGDVLVVERKPPSPYAPVPFTATEPKSSAALASALAAGSTKVAATVSVANEDSVEGVRAEHATRAALAANPTVRAVACLDDSAALGAARALDAAYPGEAESLYVGGLGAPTAGSQMTIEALEGGGCFRTLVAASPGDLAAALVEVPNKLLEGGAGEDVAIRPRLLRRGSSALRAYARDFKPGGYLGPNEVEGFFVINPAEPQPGVANGPRRAGP